jgi:hypothetical protein
MRLVIRQLIEDDGRRGRCLEPILDACEAEHARDFRDVQVAILERDAVGAVQARGNRANGSRAAAVYNGVDVPGEACAYEDRPPFAARHGSRVGDPARPELRAKVWRKAKLSDRNLRGGPRRRRPRMRA